MDEDSSAIVDAENPDLTREDKNSSNKKLGKRELFCLLYILSDLLPNKKKIVVHILSLRYMQICDLIRSA